MLRSPLRKVVIVTWPRDIVEPVIPYSQRCMTAEVIAVARHRIQRSCHQWAICECSMKDHFPAKANGSWVIGIPVSGLKTESALARLLRSSMDDFLR
jgi:hypothetical protein